MLHESNNKENMCDSYHMRLANHLLAMTYRHFCRLELLKALKEVTLSCLILSTSLETLQKVPFSPFVLYCRCTHNNVKREIW